MARIGGRNTAFAWIVGIVCLAAVSGLVYLAMPLAPAAVTWIGQQLRGETPAPVDAAPAQPAPGELPATCRQLYVDDLWSTLRRAPDVKVAESTDAPETGATDLVAALAPRVRITCAWTSGEGAISTTLADVATDAGAIATTALTVNGYECADAAGRTRCTRTDGDTTETIETGGGRWLSSVQHGWLPPDYAGRTAERAWPAD